MLQEINGSICETTIGSSSSTDTFFAPTSWPYEYRFNTNWVQYPVYVSSDRTAKAIEILKRLQEKKVVEVKSVKLFIELTETIRDLL